MTDEREDRDESEGQDDSEGQGEDQREWDDLEQGQPKITLDRYLSKRRSSPKSGLSQIVAMVLMLITLVLVIIYKDRCGDMVSGLMGDMESPTERPSVKFKLQPPSSGQAPASQPGK